MKALILVLCLAVMLPVTDRCSAAEDEGVIDITGRIRHFSYEGGFFGIEGDDGNIYKPENLSSGYKVEGMRVSVKARPVEKKLLFKPWGTPIRILEIKKGG